MKALYKNNRIHQITVLLPLSWQGVVLSSLWRQSSLWKKNKFNRMFYMCRLYMTADWCHSYGNQLRMTKFTAAWWPCLAILDRELKAKSDSKKTKKGMQQTKLNVRLLIITFFFFLSETIWIWMKGYFHSSLKPWSIGMKPTSCKWFSLWQEDIINEAHLMTIS